MCLRAGELRPYVARERATSIVRRDDACLVARVPGSDRSLMSRRKELEPVSTLNVWLFDTEGGAASASRMLRRRRAVRADHASIVITWNAERAAPRLTCVSAPDRERVPDRGLPWWDVLFDSVFLEPLRRAERGRGAGPDDEYPPLDLQVAAVNRLRDEVVPTCSALIVEGEDVDRIDELLRAHRPARRWTTGADLANPLPSLVPPR